MFLSPNMQAEDYETVLNVDIWYAISREVSATSKRGAYFGRSQGADNLLLQQVFVHGNRQDLASLCLVSRRVNAAATPWLYRSITLNSTTTKDHLSCFVNNKSAHLHLVRDFVMQGVNPSTESTQLGKLVDMLPRISNIDRLQFVSPFYAHASRLTTME